MQSDQTSSEAFNERCDRTILPDGVKAIICQQVVSHRPARTKKPHNRRWISKNKMTKQRNLNINLYVLTPKDGIPYTWRTLLHATTRRKASTWVARGAAPDKISRTLPPSPSFTWVWRKTNEYKKNKFGPHQKGRKENLFAATGVFYHLTEHNFVTNWSCIYMFISLLHVTQLAAKFF